MHIGRSVYPVLTLALLAACGEEAKAPLNPSASARVSSPMAARGGGGGGGGVTCNFTSLNKSVTRYFSGTESKVVKTLLTSMQAAGVGSTTAQGIGFDIFVRVGNNVKAGNTDVTDGGAVVNGLIACMYTSAADRPLVFPEDFSVALDPAQHGAFEVRGGANDATGAVYNRPNATPFSGVNPMSGSWTDLLAGNPAPSRVLFYGRPGSTSQTYDWKVVPRSATFAGQGALVAVCVDATTNSTSLLHEENVGLLPFVDAPWLDPASCSPIAAVSQPGLLKQLASRIGSWFVPAPLYGNPGGLGGSTSGIHSEFGPQVVDSASVTFIVQPSNVQAGAIMAPVQVLVTAAGSSSPLSQTSITLTAVNNNGTPAVLSGTLTQTTDANGIATFSDLSESKTGGYLFVTTAGAVNGRPAIIVGVATSARFNVSP